MIQREHAPIVRKDFFKGKAIIIVGPWQVGKTTLVSMLMSEKGKTMSFNADNPSDRAKLEEADFEQLQGLVRDKKFIFIDEAQKVSGIGQTLKLLVDNYKSEKQVIATGSSSLNCFPPRRNR